MQEKLHSSSNSFSENNIEKQQAFLLKLSDALRPLCNPGEIEAAVTKIAMDFMDADWCHYSTIEEDKLIILRDALRGDLPSLVGEYKISSFALFKAVLDSGHPFIVDDVHTTEILDEELKQLCGQLQNISFIIVPVIKNGKPKGMLSLVQSRPRKWTDFEVQLTIETAERTWAAVERAKAQEALRKSEEKYRSLFNSIDAGFCILEVFFNENEMPYDYRFLEANDAFEKQTGLVDAVGKTMNEMVHGHEQYWFDIYGRIAKTGKSERFENEAKALGIYYEVYAFPVGEPEENRVGVLFNNITKRKQAEEKLKESENRFRTMADALPVLIWTLDANGLSSYYNKTFRDFLGVSKDAEISDWAPIVHSEDLQLTFDTINTAMAERRSYSLEVRLLRADGQWRWVLAQGNPNIGANDEFLGFVGSSVDITERKEAEVKIKESEHRFHQMIFSSPSMIAILKGEDFIIEVANDAILHELGKGKDIIGLPYLKAVPELEEQGFGKLLRQVYKTGIPHHAHEMPGTLVHNGIEKTNYYNFIYQAQRNINNEILGIAIIASAVTTQAEFNIKIKESEQRFRSLADQSPMIVYIVEPNPSATMSYFNETWLNYTGQNFEEALGRAWDGIVHPDDLQTVFDIYVPAFEARHSYTLPAVRLKRFDGEYRWHVFKGNPRHLANNEFNGFVGVGFDIHEQKVAEEKLAYRTALLEAHNHASGDGILLIDAKGKIISFNRRFVEIWSIPKHIVNAKDDEAILSFTMTQLVTPQLFIDRVKLHCKHQTETVLDELEFKDGKIIELNGYSVIGEDAKYYAWSWTFRDITVQKDYEKAIIESEKLLEQKVIERTEQLEEKNIELQKMNKELEAFTYVSSHDLQEPLRKIQTFAGRIIATEKEHLSENAKDYFGRMQNSATRMQALIQDLLAFSRISTSERKFEIVDLEKIVAEVKEEFKESIEEKNAVVTTGEMCKVNIIPFQFRQLMHNLISNALKFSKQDVPLIIRIQSKIISGSDSPLGSRKTCHITVTDNGIGFEKEFSEKIFEVFQKLHVKEKYAGTGIGLAIVKKIVENHNGMVTTESELGKGTRFNIYIPMRQK